MKLKNMGLDSEEEEKLSTQKKRIPITVTLSEGNKYLRLLHFDKAVASFNKILDQNPNHVLSLLGRAKCYMRLAKYGEAWDDFDRVLHLNPECTEAIRLKGVTEYLKGDFENSFITYWQGHLKKTEDKNLKQGFRFCKKVIENSLVTDKSTFLTDKDIFKMRCLINRNSSSLEENSDGKNTDFTNKGFFSDDLKLLEDILSDENSTFLHPACKDLYDFLIAKRKFREMLDSHMTIDKSNYKIFVKNNIRNLLKMSRLVRNFKLCKIALKEGDTLICLKKGSEVLNSLKNVPPGSPAKNEMQVETLHSLVTVCLMEEDLIKARNYCEQQLNFINESNLQTFKGRALRDFGEVYCKTTEHRKAVLYFEESLEFSECEKEKAVILYKISDCNMHLNNLEDAQVTAQKCLDIATRYQDMRFQIDILLLLAEIGVKGRDMELGKSYYKEAFEMAIESNDDRRYDLEHLLSIFEEVASKSCYSKERIQIMKLTNSIKHT